MDEASRLAYVEVIPDEKQETTIAFLLRAVAWFKGHGINYCRITAPPTVPGPGGRPASPWG